MDELENLNIGYLEGRTVCATGRLASMTHAELAKLVSACGGTYIRTPQRRSFILVIGDGGWPLEKDGSPSIVFHRARQLMAYGYAIEFTSEDDFLEELGLTQPAGAIRGRHTLSDLNRILDISSVRLRRWMRAGLIEPVATRFQIPYFDFHQVAFIKQLHDLIEDGASLASIRRGIEQTKDLLPQRNLQSTDWSSIERDGRVLIRLRGQLVDQFGQRYFDFDAAGENDPTLFAEAIQSGFHDLCDEALALEDAGRYQEAADAYQRALQLKPDQPTLHFDLGNVLFQLGRVEESVTAFRSAIQIDPDYAMAWHNLGCVYTQLAEWDTAETSLRRALSLVPTYADSHFTLAEVLRNQGKQLEADRHQSAHLEYSRANCMLGNRESFLRIAYTDAE